jgi:hypothetical protein
MVIFHSYVSLPEGKHLGVNPMFSGPQPYVYPSRVDCVCKNPHVYRDTVTPNFLDSTAEGESTR